MVERVEKEFGPIDVLVNSAGAAKRTDADDLTPAAWRAGMDAKYFSYINVIDPVIKKMGKRGEGAVINVIGERRQGRLAHPSRRRRRQCGPSTGHRRPRLCLRVERRARGGSEPRRDQNRARRRRPEGRSEARQRLRGAGRQADGRAPADGPARRARGDRRHRGVRRVGARALPHRRQHQYRRRCVTRRCREPRFVFRTRNYLWPWPRIRCALSCSA